VARYTQDSIERVREAVDVVEVIGARTELRRVGTRWTGLCPFHDERTPSFSVDPDKGFYYCFGCQEGGDAIGFVRETEGVDFPEAVELLAERYNVELKREREDPHEEEMRRRRERMTSLLERAAGFYERYLRDSKEAGRAREYLAARGLGQAVLTAYRIGYAPKAWDTLLLGAQRDGFTLEELHGAGLARKGKNGGSYDFFRERITFPISDVRGRVLGFGARAMREEQGGKYVNTPEGGLFHKGRLLFGIDLAAKAAAKNRRMIVAEGYTDVLALHQAGFEETVALMGTAATEHQIAELARRVGAEGIVYLALDADSSGQDAMLRATKIAEAKGLALRVIELPDGRDPAELLAEEGAEAFSERIDRSLSVLQFAVRKVLADADLSDDEGVDRALAQSRGLIARAPERSAVRDGLIRLVSERLSVPLDYVMPRPGDRPARAVDVAAADGDPGPERPERSERNPLSELERRFLSLCLASGDAGKMYLDRIGPDHLTSDAVRRARDHLAEHFDDPLEGMAQDDRELMEVVAGAALSAEEGEPPDGAALRMGFLQLDLRRIERQVRTARKDGDLEQQGLLATERQRVRSEMDTVMGQAT
jgi:DNA primase